MKGGRTYGEQRMDEAAQAWLEAERFPCRFRGQPVKFGAAVKFVDGTVAHPACDRAHGAAPGGNGGPA